MRTAELRIAWVGAALFLVSCNPGKTGQAADNQTSQPPKGGVAELKPSECEELGGTIHYDSQCDDYKLTCKVVTTTGTNKSCIDELDAAPE
jgi:hypothetical protein